MEPEEFYNQESTKYSQKRYEGVTDTYVKYFFKKRLSLVLKYLDVLTKGNLSRKVTFRGYNLLEVGCADGVVLRKIANKIPNQFEELVGVDIAVNMINQARTLTANKNISFFEVGQTPNEKFDAILFVGFMSQKLWQKYLPFIHEHLADGGSVIISLAGFNSLQARFKLADKEYAREYLSYSGYERMFGLDFKIESKEYYGLFFPKLWTWPALARFIQPFLDRVFAQLVPELFHECLYLLRKNNS